MSDSIFKADLDLRKDLFAHIVLAGGSTMCVGECGGKEGLRGSGRERKIKRRQRERVVESQAEAETAAESKSGGQRDTPRHPL